MLSHYTNWFLQRKILIWVIEWFDKVENSSSCPHGEKWHTHTHYEQGANSNQFLFKPEKGRRVAGNEWAEEELPTSHFFFLFSFVFAPISACYPWSRVIWLWLEIEIASGKHQRTGGAAIKMPSPFAEGRIKIQICNKLTEIRGSQPKLPTLRALMLQMTGANNHDEVPIPIPIPIAITIQIPIQIGPNANDDVCASET